MEVTFSEYFDYVHHDPMLPPLTDGRDPVRRPVCVVGGGPTGLAVALGLARYGVPSVVLEADDTVCTGSRAGAITRRTLEIFQQLGVIEPALETGFAWSEGRTFYRDRLVYSFRMPHDENQQFPPGMSLQQNYVEQYLVDEIGKHPDLIQVRWQSSVQSVAQSDDGVELAVTTPLGDYQLTADWVVACDGGRSAVRRELGLELEGTAYEGRYVIIDIRIDTDGFPIGRRCWFDPPSNPGSTLLMYTKPGNMVRFDYQLRPDEDVQEAMRPEVVLGRVAKHLAMMGVDRPWEPVWISLYKANALTLADYRRGRVLFAGDAAHLVPIFGVRGMNSSLDDAHNLAWKLALVVQGKAENVLLDSYSAERVYAARENLRLAGKSAEFMAPPPGPAKLMRDAVLSLCADHPWISTLLDPRQHSAIPLTASPLNTGDPAQQWASGPAAGDILRECPVEIDGVAGYLSDAVGPHFTLLYFGEGVPDPIVALPERVGVPLRICSIVPAGVGQPGAMVDASGRLFGLYDAVAGAAYLVRPDGHVLGRWRDLDAQTLTEAVVQGIDGTVAGRHTAPAGTGA